MNNNRALASRFLCIQAMVAGGLSLLWGLISGKSAFYAAIWGGACGLLPTGVLIWVMFKNSGARTARQIMGDFYKGEVLKFFTTVILITVALGGHKVSGLPFLLTFIGAVLIIWLSAVVMK